MSGAWVYFPEGRDGVITGLRRATVLQTDDSGSQQILKQMRGIASEQFSDVYRAQGHGFSSHAPQGSEGLYLALGGRSDRLIGLGFEHKDYRPTGLPEGAAVLYDSSGNVVRVKTADGIQIDASKGRVYVKPAAGEIVYLGGTGKDGAYDFVVTLSGPSINVKARIG